MLTEAQLLHLDHILEGGPYGACDETEAIKHVRFLLWDQVKLVDSAVELLDTIKGNELAITCYTSIPAAMVPITTQQSSRYKRRCWRVPGSAKGTEYTCLLSYCPCRNYTDMVKQAGQTRGVMCKHLVAVRMATLLGQVTQESLPDAQFVVKMCQENNEAISAVRNLQWG